MDTTWSVDLGRETVQPQCLCATDEAVWWVSTTGVLYTWRGHDVADTAADVPDPIALVQLDSRAHFMTVSTHDTIAIATAHYVSLYAIVREYAPLFLHGQATVYDDDDGEDDDRDNADREICSETTEVVITVEEIHRIPCRLPNDLCGGDLNHDASCAALCSSSGLYVVDCTQPSLQKEAAMQGSSNKTNQSAVQLYACTQLGASTRGCRFACFSGVTQLVVLDEVNHLLLLRCQTHQEYEDCSHSPQTGPNSATVELLVDGHVLTRTARATALACSHGALDTSLILIGFSNGQVRVLDGETLQQLRLWDVSAALLLPPSEMPHISSTTAAAAAAVSSPGRGDAARWVRRESQLSRPPRGGAAQSSLSVHDTSSQPPPSSTAAALQRLPVLDVQIGLHLFTISTPQGVMYYNRHTFQLQPAYTFRFHPPLVRVDDDAAQAAEDQIQFCSAPNGSWCYTNAFEGTLYYAATGVDTQHAVEQREADEELAATDWIHARVPLPASWLSSGAAAKPQERKEKRASGGGFSAGASAAVRATNTTRRPAKGSGYGDAPWSVQQARKRKAQAAAAQDRKAADFGLPPTSSANRLRFVYPNRSVEAGLPSCTFRLMERPTQALRHLHASPVLATTFDTAGEALVTAGGDGSVQHLQFPIARAKRTGGVVGRVLAGHPAAVTALDTNLSRQSHLVLTGCADGKLRLWAPGVQDAPLSVCSTATGQEHVGNGALHSAAATATPATPAAAAAVTCAQFFYLDKLVLSCTRDCLELRRHSAAPTSTTTAAAASLTSSVAASASTTRLSTTPVLRHSVGVGHTITAASGVNHFTSNLVVFATSAKAVQVLDVATNTVLWGNTTTHSRTIYRVALGRTSRYATAMPNSAAHLFASAGLDGTVALWDVRVKTPVQLYTQHSNSAIPSLGLELAPGNDMMAVASQDNRVYLYDIRKGGVGRDGGSRGNGAAALAVLQGFDTYVTSLAWHPLQPILAAGLANGDVQLFSAVEAARMT